MVQIYGKTAPRAVIGSTLADIYKEQKNIIVIDNDLGSSTSALDFHKTAPTHFWELGIGEQSSLSAASGLALEGFIPFYVNFAIFATGTVWTQIRQAAYARLNIKITATHPGLDAGPDGASHQATQDMALMRCMPNMHILLPCDENDVRAALRYAARHNGMYYIRVSREPVPVIYRDEKESHFDISNKLITATGNDIALLFDGSTLEQALESVEELSRQGIGVQLIHVRSLKPLDVQHLDQLPEQVKAVVTLENHSVIGGLGSAVAEYFASRCFPVGIVGVPDKFTESGKSTELKEKYGVSVRAVVEKAKMLLGDIKKN